MSDVSTDRADPVPASDPVGFFNGRTTAALGLIAAALAIALFVLLPVAAELDRVQPLMAEIEQQAGTELSCIDWYGVGSGIDTSFDPNLVDSIVDGGRDIYLWPIIYGVPTLIVAGLMLLLAWALPESPAAKVVVRSGVLLAVAAVLLLGPFGHEYDSALQCLLE